MCPLTCRGKTSSGLLWFEFEINKNRIGKSLSLLGHSCIVLESYKLTVEYWVLNAREHTCMQSGGCRSHCANKSQKVQMKIDYTISNIHKDRERLPLGSVKSYILSYSHFSYYILYDRLRDSMTNIKYILINIYHLVVNSKWSLIM